MKLGVSLSPAFLCGQAASVHQTRMLSGGVRPFLTRLREAGCTHIELRAVRSGTAEEEVAGAVRAAKSAGFCLTVHGTLTDEPADIFWGRLEPALSVQNDLCVTVHSASTRENTVRLLRHMGDYAAAHHPDARLALENNRSKKGDNVDLVECGGVLATLEDLSLPNAGSCWDFGHFYWDRLTHPSLVPSDLPPEGFLCRAVHAHIHSVCENTTHFPLTMGDMPLKAYLTALKKVGYRGVYNLEPEPERWNDSIDAAQEIVRSVSLLHDMLKAIEEEFQ